MDSAIQSEKQRPQSLGALADPGRLAALRQSGLLGHARRSAFDRITSLVHRLLNVPVSLVSLIDDERQIIASQIGLPELPAEQRSIPIGDSFCHLTVLSGEPVIIDDARRHPLLGGHPAIESIGVIAYAGVPLRTADGHVLGAICAGDRRPRRWTEEEVAVLLDLAALASDEIEYGRRLQHVPELESLVRRLEEPVRGLTDRVRSLTTLVSNDPDPRVQRFAALAAARVTGVERVLHEVGAAIEERAAPSGPEAAVDLRLIVRASLESSVPSDSGDLVRIDLGRRPIPVSGNAHHLQRSITSLLRSALHYASGTEALHVRARAEGDMAWLEIADQGRGIPAAELARIVSRFSGASRGAHGPNGHAASLRLADRAVTVDNGTVQARSGRGGTVFRMTLPLAAASADDESA